MNLRRVGISDGGRDEGPKKVSRRSQESTKKTPRKAQEPYAGRGQKVASHLRSQRMMDENISSCTVTGSRIQSWVLFPQPLSHPLLPLAF